MKFKKSLFFLSLLSILFTSISCEDDSATTSNLSSFVGVEEAKNVGVVLGETIVVESKVYASNATNTDRVFNLVVDAATTHAQTNFVVPATVTIPAGSKEGVFQVSIVGNSIANAGNKLVLSMAELDGNNQNFVFNSDSQTYSNKKIVYNISEVCQTGLTKVQLAIKFDNFPEETAWELYDSSFNVVSSGGFTGTAITGYAALGFADRSTFISNFCLAPGTYTFVIYDDYGDGMYTSATVSGDYSLKLADGTVLASGGGDFGTFQDTEFTIQ
ncbi:hypothetical protein [Flavobacterium dankookense]|uniref:DUF4382 domain-containing protein n=1 Tax=Flavobacterium dankookense TaxID=706186 RepID=A0A4R6Q8J6_9FLAO|nr:hypothetical protein [Flavobacterium dankookense]TDP58377.1 hypothetical protein BC748_2421 [Flavobacterium dankookense]